VLKGNRSGVEKNVHTCKYKSMYNVYIFVGVGVLGQKKGA